MITTLCVLSLSLSFMLGVFFGARWFEQGYRSERKRLSEPAATCGVFFPDTGKGIFGFANPSEIPDAATCRELSEIG